MSDALEKMAALIPFEFGGLEAIVETTFFPNESGRSMLGSGKRVWRTFGWFRNGALSPTSPSCGFIAKNHRGSGVLGEEQSSDFAIW
jgi:hypothetical protein